MQRTSSPTSTRSLLDPARPAETSDAELVALAVCQAAMGISSDRQFLGLVPYRLPGWFPHLPSQSQYNRRLRSLVELISTVQQRLAHWLDAGEVRLADGTLLGCANYPGCSQCSDLWAVFEPLRERRGIDTFGSIRPTHVLASVPSAQSDPLADP